MQDVLFYCFLQDGPAILPRCDMLKVLLGLVSTGSRKVTKVAKSVLLAVCTSASGGDGCTLAEDDEIDVLMDALTWSSSDIRLLALQVCLYRE